MTCVCSVGLDAIAIPGDTSASTISRLIASEAPSAWSNPEDRRAQRVPVAGRGVGEMANFGGLMSTRPSCQSADQRCEAFVTVAVVFPLDSRLQGTDSVGYLPSKEKYICQIGICFQRYLK